MDNDNYTVTSAENYEFQGQENNYQDYEAEEQKQARKEMWKSVAIGGISGIALGAGFVALTGFTSKGEEPQPEGDGEIIDTPEPVEPEIPVATCVNDSMSFSQAFAAARDEVGPGGVFTWHGGVYGTYYADEWNAMTDEEQDQFSNHFGPAPTAHNHHNDVADTHNANNGAETIDVIDDPQDVAQGEPTAHVEVPGNNVRADDYGTRGMAQNQPDGGESQSQWYIVDENGNMVPVVIGEDGIARDAYGNEYMIDPETNPNFHHNPEIENYEVDDHRDYVNDPYSSNGYSETQTEDVIEYDDERYFTDEYEEYAQETYGETYDEPYADSTEDYAALDPVADNDINNDFYGDINVDDTYVD